jgi:hypothetical protein
MIIEHVRSMGDLAPELDSETAIDTLWIFNDPGHYAALVIERGWSEQAFHRWLADRMHDALLPD